MTEIGSSNEETLDLQDQDSKNDLSEDPTDAERSRENSPKRIFLPSDLNLEEDKDQILNLWKDQEKYVDFLESKLNPSDSKDEKVSVQHIKNPISNSK